MLLQALLGPLAQQRLHLRMDVLRHDGQPGAGVLDVVAQLGGHVHRVHRHHHGVGAQDAVVGQHELRAVLHVEQHAVALLHALALQPAGDALGLVLELGVADLGVVEHQEGLGRVAPRRDLDVVEQVGLRDRHVARQALGPVGEVAVDIVF
jgi:hypothetical protein